MAVDVADGQRHVGEHPEQGVLRWPLGAHGYGGCSGWRQRLWWRVEGGGGAEVEDVGGPEVAGGGPDIADTRLVGARVSHLREMLRGRRRGRRKREGGG